MKRTIVKKVTGHRTTDGAGVELVRVLGRNTAHLFDPILILDSFDSTNPDDYTAGFPMHPHRGTENIIYIYRGNMVHKDSLGNEDRISDGEMQWLTAGSGVMHEEQLPAAERLLGLQLWLNLPGAEKMSAPSYRSLHREDIPEISFDGGYLRLLSGHYGEHKGFIGDHLPLDYYDIHLEEGASLTLFMAEDDSVMVFTFIGDVTVAGEVVAEKTAVKLSEGTELVINASEGAAQVMYMCSRPLNEDIAWAGPIVMNSQSQMHQAFRELRAGTFVKEELDFQNEGSVG